MRTTQTNNPTVPTNRLFFAFPKINHDFLFLGLRKLIILILYKNVPSRNFFEKLFYVNLLIAYYFYLFSIFPNYYVNVLFSWSMQRMAVAKECPRHPWAFQQCCVEEIVTTCQVLLSLFRKFKYKHFPTN